MAQAKCSHRDAKVERRYDKNGHPRVKHAFLPCRNAAVRVDVYGKGYADEFDFTDPSLRVCPKCQRVNR